MRPDGDEAKPRTSTPPATGTLRGPGEPSEGPVRLDATVSGRVQGVGFRYFVLRVASGLDLTGWVANTPDGSVQCVAEGERRDLERLLSALRDGPPGARVDRVAVEW